MNRRSLLAGLLAAVGACSSAPEATPAADLAADLGPIPVEEKRRAFASAVDVALDALPADGRPVCLAIPPSADEPEWTDASILPLLRARRTPHPVERCPATPGSAQVYLVSPAVEFYELPDSARVRLEASRGDTLRLFECTIRPAEAGYRSTCTSSAAAF